MDDEVIAEIGLALKSNSRVMGRHQVTVIRNVDRLVKSLSACRKKRESENFCLVVD